MDDELDELKKLRAELTAEIDWEILSTLLSIEGWTKVKLDYTHKKQEQEIITWVIENISGSFKSHHPEWMFKHAKDAAFFTLKWS